MSRKEDGGSRSAPKKRGAWVDHWLVVALLATMACTPPPPPNPIPSARSEIFVNALSPQAKDDCATNGTQAMPLASVPKAIDCALAPSNTGDIAIAVLCDPAVKSGKCDYDLAGHIFGKYTKGRITLRGEPYQMVRLQQQFDGTSSSAVVIQDNWTLQSVVFDGMGDTLTGDPGSSGFIRIQGNDVTLDQNEITNTASTCVAITNGTDTSAVPHHRIVLSHNYIHGCHSPNQYQDRHCVYNRIASEVTISYNEITDCGGDGYQIENYLVEDENKPGQLPTHFENLRLGQVAMNNHIIGNRIYTRSIAGVRWGENAIDVKRAGA